eukprot:516594-Pyramimonas_sp.AAC.1
MYTSKTRERAFTIFSINTTRTPHSANSGYNRQRTGASSEVTAMEPCCSRAPPHSGTLSSGSNSLSPRCGTTRQGV